MDKAVVRCVKLKMHQMMQIGHFSLDKQFACHIVSPHCLPPSTPIEVVVVLPTLVKKLSNMARNSASYAFNSWHIDRL